MILSKKTEIATAFQNNNAALQHTIFLGRTEFKKPEEVLRATGAGTGSFHQGSSDSRAAKRLVHSRDYKFPRMPETCSSPHYSK